MTKLPILDLVMIGEDKDLATSLQDTVRLAQCAERSGYRDTGSPNITACPSERRQKRKHPLQQPEEAAGAM